MFRKSNLREVAAEAILSNEDSIRPTGRAEFRGMPSYVVGSFDLDDERNPWIGER